MHILSGYFRRGLLAFKGNGFIFHNLQKRIELIIFAEFILADKTALLAALDDKIFAIFHFCINRLH